MVVVMGGGVTTEYEEEYGRDCRRFFFWVLV